MYIAHGIHLLHKSRNHALIRMSDTNDRRTAARIQHFLTRFPVDVVPLCADRTGGNVG